MSTRGIRNNNPGNIRDFGIKWNGLIGRDEGGYAIFDTAINGIRAMVIDLRTGFRRDGEDSVREIITEYAPPVENITSAYIDAVSKALDVGPDEVFSESRMPELITAIIYHENGRQPYPDAVIDQAIRAAYS